ncbi:glycoside hydrolase family 3 protein, partial [Saccharothrix sp. MB29]|nr:glycoside hydrolase family 3 protein [Saccharothrix sp. MB29]
AGTVIGDDGRADYGAISATPEGSTGMRVTWTGTSNAQVYFQHGSGGSDVTAHAGPGSALLVDLVVHQRPTAPTVFAVHCVYPCAAELDVTPVLRGLPVGAPRTVKIPITCFTDAGLDPRKVNTPFLVGTAGRFDAAFGHVRWAAGAAEDPDATSCEDLG